jgi:threonine/homoserine/homoserine lactone efflux protein
MPAMTVWPQAPAFVQSLLIGLSIAAPVGPIGLLTIQRTLAQGRLAGLATGLGAALADAVYGAIGAFGASALIAWLTGLRFWLVAVGGAVLLALAWQVWRSAPPERAAATPGGRALWRHFAGTFVLTLSNPATILSFMAIFGALAGRLPSASPAVMVAGVLLGSALWWWLLTAVVGRLRQRFDARWHRRVNRVSALLLAALALWPALAWLQDRLAGAGSP